MIFHSLDYLIFLPLVVAIYWMLNREKQVIFLIGVSYFFYGYIHPWFLYLILTSTVVDYYCGLAMGRLPEHKHKLLLLSISVNLGLLGFFKYFGFFVDNVAELFILLGLPSFTNNLDIYLPVGISFYTFQTMSYTIDIYRGQLKPRKNFLDFALFVSFFPQLVAGPIERAVNFLPQVEKKRSLSVSDVQSALFLLVWGFFKKLVIADNIAFIVSKIFLLENTSFLLVWVGAFAFGIQVFADFSAYTDIARGSARLLGFKLSQNFNHPYISASPTEFWKRWHISLTSWIHDYIFLPLALSRRLRTATGGLIISLFITFFINGLWHGAGWNFILWGLYHFALLLIYAWAKSVTPEHIRDHQWLRPFQIFLMFLLLHPSYIIFLNGDVSYIWRDLTLSPFVNSEIQTQAALFLFGKALFFSIPLWAHTIFSYVRERFWTGDSWKPLAVQVVASMIMFISILVLRGDSVDFIYFQF
ncbi:MAG: MBOAT family protein [Magnetococcales bacterium]|nr:MBOAT family protein [Magnetococcales bacterium]